MKKNSYDRKDFLKLKKIVQNLEADMILCKIKITEL